MATKNNATKKTAPVSAVGEQDAAVRDLQKQPERDAVEMSDEPAPNKDALNQEIERQGEAKAPANAPESAIGDAEEKADDEEDADADDEDPDKQPVLMSKEPSPGDPVPVTDTGAEPVIDPEIKPNFASMDAKDMNRWFTTMTNWFRDRGAVVNGLDLKEFDSLVEGKYSWRYNDDKAEGGGNTVAATAGTALEASRAVAEQVSAKRYEY